MKNVIHQLISFTLPIIVLIVVPLSIEIDIAIINTGIFLAGVVVMLLGLFLLVLSVTRIIKKGKGTLAPWKPSQKLVIDGAYRYVRNPMILGVLTILIGESIAIMSSNILIWAIVFFFINTLFFLVYEEPNLEKKFGDEYRKYKANVNRWIPRLKPFDKN